MSELWQNILVIFWMISAAIIFLFMVLFMTAVAFILNPLVWFFVIIFKMGGGL